MVCVGFNKAAMAPVHLQSEHWWNIIIFPRKKIPSDIHFISLYPINCPIKYAFFEYPIKYHIEFPMKLIQLNITLF